MSQQLYMYTKYLLFIPLLLIISSCSNNTTSLQGEGYVLRLSLEEGKRYNIDMEVIQNITEVVDRSNVVTDQTVNVHFHVDVDSTDEQGNYHLIAKFVEISLIKNIPLEGSVELSSKNLNPETRVDSIYASAIKNMLNQQVKIIIDSTGKILERSVLELIKPDTSKASVTKNNINILGEQTTSKQNLEWLFVHFPKDSVLVGEVWQDEIGIESALPMLIKKSLFIESTEDEKVEIALEADISLNDKAIKGKDDLQKTISGTQTGKFIVNVNSGWPEKAEIYNEIKIMERIGMKILKTINTTINFSASKDK